MWLDDLRKRPKAAKQRMAFLGAGVVTGVIALFWGAALSVQFGDGGTQFAADDTAVSTSAFGQFFGDAKENMASIIAPLRPEEVTSTTTATSTNEGVEIATSSEKVDTTENFTFVSSTAPIRRPALIETRSATATEL
ncbi:MAG: hypothetical protein R3B69_03585 [Candidatus Paceibacterota bacterium]